MCVFKRQALIKKNSLAQIQSAILKRIVALEIFAPVFSAACDLHTAFNSVWSKSHFVVFQGFWSVTLPDWFAGFKGIIFQMTQFLFHSFLADSDSDIVRNAQCMLQIMWDNVVEFIVNRIKSLFYPSSSSSYWNHKDLCGSICLFILGPTVNDFYFLTTEQLSCILSRAKQSGHRLCYMWVKLLQIVLIQF